MNKGASYILQSNHALILFNNTNFFWGVDNSIKEVLLWNSRSRDWSARLSLKQNLAYIQVIMDTMESLILAQDERWRYA